MHSLHCVYVERNIHTIVFIDMTSVFIHMHSLHCVYVERNIHTIVFIDMTSVFIGTGKSRSTTLLTTFYGL
jgi:hypothetical protein